MAFGISIIGDKAVIRNLHSLAERTQRKILKKVVRRVQKPMIAEARRRVRRRSGQLAKSLGTVIRTYKQTNVIAVAGPRGGFRTTWNGRPIDPVFYAHLVEGGHRIARGGKLASKKGRRTKGKQGEHTGDVPAYPFLGPAFEANKDTAKTAAIREIAKEIEKEAEREANRK